MDSVTQRLTVAVIEPPKPDHIVHAEQAIDELLEALPHALTTGDELFTVVTGLLGYGARDRRLQAMCRRMQKTLERRPLI